MNITYSLWFYRTPHVHKSSKIKTTESNRKRARWIKKFFVGMNEKLKWKELKSIEWNTKKLWHLMRQNFQLLPNFGWKHFHFRLDCCFISKNFFGVFILISCQQTTENDSESLHTYKHRIVCYKHTLFRSSNAINRCDRDCDYCSTFSWFRFHVRFYFISLYVIPANVNTWPSTQKLFRFLFSFGWIKTRLCGSANVQMR